MAIEIIGVMTTAQAAERKVDTHITAVHTHRTTQAERVYFIKQKFAGLILVILGVLSVIVSDGDGTAALIIVPLGIFVMLTKNKIMNF